jgi:hypothetical protein
MTTDVFLSLRLFKGSEDFVSYLDSVGQAFQPGRELLELIVPEITVPYPCCQDQVIILNRDILPIGRFYEDAPLVLVHASDLAHDHGGILLPSQNLPDWGTDLSRRKHCWPGHGA